MKALRDPEGVEAGALKAACPFPGSRVLEIGCGSGILTWQYAALPRTVVGIDPDAAVLAQAQMDRPASLSSVSLLRAAGEALPFPTGGFDIVIFASSF